MKKIAYLFLLLVFLGIGVMVLLGPSAKSRLIGTWEGKPVITAEPDSGVAGAAANFLGSLVENANVGNVTYQFNADDTVTGVFALGAMQNETSGTWKVVETDGDVVTIEIDGEAKAQQMVVTFHDDDHFTATSPGSATGIAKVELQFTRIPK